MPERKKNRTMDKNISILPIGTYLSKWGEGPIFWQGKLFYVDIEGHSLIQLNPDTGEERVWKMGERIGTVVPTMSHQFICAGDSGIYSFDPKSGEKKNLADPESGKRQENRFNDGKCDPRGRFWAGTISTVKKTGDANLYRLGLDGSLSLVLSSVTNSNGICWNADATIMYYIDTPTKQIVAYRFNNDDGTISQPSLVVDFNRCELAGSPDGMTIDAEGMLWVAMCHGGAVLKINSETGEILQKIDFPCLETTACWFGGQSLDRLFVTTGIHNSLNELNAGRIFVVDGLQTNGLPTIPFKGRFKS